MRTSALVLIALFLAGTTLSAALCPECRTGGPYTKDIGECASCKERRTGSGEFPLCWQCSEKLQQCEHCRKPLAAATQPTTRPIDTTKDDAYREGRWEYRYTISNAGTRSKGYYGVLLFDGTVAPEPKAVNDHYVTPWGKLYWVGQPVVAFGGHGWMPKPKPSAPIGTSLGAPGPATRP